MYFIIFKVYKSDFDGINFVYFKYLTSTLFKIIICEIASLFNISNTLLCFSFIYVVNCLNLMYFHIAVLKPNLTYL